jgi:GlpG protein
VARRQIWEVGNAAHLSGLAFGWIAASYFVAQYRPRLTLAGLAGMLVLAVIPLFWCPWSAAWLGNKAYHAQAGRRYQDALELYTRVLQIDPRNAWAYYNRGGVYYALGEFENAKADVEMARKLDPKIDKTR